MVEAKTKSERIREAEKENRRLKAALMKANAVMEYIAMMADVDLEEDEEDAQ